MISLAHAMGQGGAGAQGAGGIQSFIPIIAMVVIFYFLLIRPQQKKQKEHRIMIGNLKKGDQIITTGGLYGRITGISPTVITLEIAEKVRVKLKRDSVTVLSKPGPQPQQTQQPQQPQQGKDSK